MPVLIISYSVQAAPGARSATTGLLSCIAAEFGEQLAVLAAMGFTNQAQWLASTQFEYFKLKSRYYMLILTVCSVAALRAAGGDVNAALAFLFE